MEVLTGDENGLLKSINVEAKQYFKFGDTIARSRGILGLCPANNDLALFRNDGMVELFTQYDNNMFGSFASLDLNINGAKGCFGVPGSSLFACFSGDGLVKLVDFSDNDLKVRNEFSNKGPLHTGDGCSNGCIVGGRENDIQLYDLTTLENVWQARNVPHDSLQLRVPIWHTALKFINSNENSPSGATILSGTGYKHVRTYDTRVSRQPVSSFVMDEDYRVTSLLPSHCGSICYVGDTSGGLHMWDLRTQRRMYTLKGFNGSIRDISMSSNGQYVSAVGLDRFLRVYKASNGQLVSSCYLKNRLNCCMFWKDGANLSDGADENEDNNSLSDEDEEEDNNIEYDDGKDSSENGSAVNDDELEDLIVSSDEEDSDSVSEKEVTSKKNNNSSNKQTNHDGPKNSSGSKRNNQGSMKGFSSKRSKN